MPSPTPPDEPFQLRVDETHGYPPLGAAMGHFPTMLDDRGMADPFHTTIIQPRGWRSAWAVLRGRYCARVRVDATPHVVGRVMEAIQDAQADKDAGVLHANRYSPLGRVTREDGTLDIEKMREGEGQ